MFRVSADAAGRGHNNSCPGVNFRTGMGGGRQARPLSSTMMSEIETKSVSFEPVDRFFQFNDALFLALSR
jgi:hypothetical protein